MKTYTIQLTNSQAEDLYFCVSSATTQALIDDCLGLYDSLCHLREYLVEQGFSVVMK